MDAKQTAATLQDPPQPAEGALEVLALRPLSQGERPAELRATARAFSTAGCAAGAPRESRTPSPRRRSLASRVGPALRIRLRIRLGLGLGLRLRAAGARLESRIDGAESPSSRWRPRVASLSVPEVLLAQGLRLAALAARVDLRRWSWSVMATATFRRAATSTRGAVPRCAKGTSVMAFLRAVALRRLGPS